MSVRVVRTRNGEDVICDLFEVTMKDDPENLKLHSGWTILTISLFSNPMILTIS